MEQVTECVYVRCIYLKMVYNTDKCVSVDVISFPFYEDIYVYRHIHILSFILHRVYGTSLMYYNIGKFFAIKITVCVRVFFLFEV